MIPMAMPLWAGWVGAGGVLLSALVLVVEGWARPGYSPTRHPVSALALGKRGWIQTANFQVSGAAITVGAIDLGTGGHHLLLAGVVTVFGLALVASGPFGWTLSVDIRRALRTATRRSSPGGTDGTMPRVRWCSWHSPRPRSSPCS